MTQSSGVVETTAALDAATETGAGLIERMLRAVRPMSLGVAAAQLGLILAVMWVFRVEDRKVMLVLGLALPAFVVHHVLPLAWRLPFFGMLSMASVLVLFGESGQALLGGVYLIGCGVALILICHLPIAFGARVALLVGAAAVLALARGHVFELPPIFAAIWPILGSMFMFRIIVYMHDLRHRQAPFGFWRSLGYFFMAPNVCFPMFPLVDYKTYCRTYYNDDAFRIYQSGLVWMMRGVVQLVLYRFIYQNLLIPGEAVESIGGVARFMITTYLLYLHISGQFHLIVGLLHLFGFNLPETHHRFLLASSFIDFWRRINIYWKDFMQKVFFFPAYFRLKKVMPERRALELATIFVFAVTWAFHSYQWFWLLGSFPIKGPDIVFWGLLGVLVLANEMYRQAGGRAKRRGAGKSRSLRFELAHAGRTIATFVAICVLWSLWNSHSLGEWWATVSRAGNAPLVEVGAIVLFLLGIGVAAVLWGHSSSERTEGRPRAGQADGRTMWRGALYVACVGGLALGARQLPQVLPANSDLAKTIENLTESKLNTADAALMERGYYEDLTDVGRFNPELAKLFTAKPAHWKDLHETPIIREVDSVLAYELLPSQSIEFKEQTLTTNRWGMRDREYERSKPAGVYRIALLGSSHSMGSGVENDETFENIAEDRLNEASGPGGGRVEVLNFSVAGYGSVAQLEVLKDKGLEFDLDMALFEVHMNESQRTVRHLLQAWADGKPIPDYVVGILREAGISPEAPRYQVERRLKQRADDVVREVLVRFGRECRSRGVEPALFLMAKPDNYRNVAAREGTRRWLEGIAEGEGMTFFDIADAYDGVEDPTTLMVAPWDGHPNEAGHELLARRLSESLSGYLRRGGVLAPTEGAAPGAPEGQPHQRGQ